MLSIGIIIISGVVIISYNIRLQKSDVQNISLAGKQSSLSERILSEVLFIGSTINKHTNKELSRLKSLTDQLERSQRYLYSKNIENNKIIDSLFTAITPNYNKILTSSRAIISNPSPEVLEKSLETILEAEVSFRSTMELIRETFEKNDSRKLQRLLHILWILASIILLILFGESVFVMTPVIKEMLQINNELMNSNEELAKSEHRIKKNMLELTKLKTDLEVKETYNKIFIEQAPTAIAMLDNNMRYMAVSQHWIADYKMEGKEIIGQSHYDLFPEIGDDWKANHQKCLKGTIDKCDEAPFTRSDGSVQWIYWDVRPWYISEGKIGGLLMHTGDITHLKEKEQEKIKTEGILAKTNEVARIGAWDLDLLTNKVYWSRIVYEIHGLPEHSEVDLEAGINFYKEGKSRDAVKEAINAAIEHGIPFDLEVEFINKTGTIIWVRILGQAEVINGNSTRILGIFQDINTRKLSEIALDKTNSELKAVLNSGTIGILSLDNNGIINHFNRGAEQMLGYEESEVIGLTPGIFHVKEEIEKFRDDMAASYDLDREQFNPFLVLAKHNINDTREWTYIRKDGSTLPVQLTLSAVKNEVGENIGFLGVSVDVTERNNAKNDLLKKNQLLSFAEEITMMGHWQWDTVADKVIWSNNLYKMFELDEGTTDLKFDSYFNFVHPKDKDIVTEYFGKAATDKKFQGFTHRIVTTTGIVKTVQLLGEVFTNEKGEIIEMIGTGQDITEQRMAENKFRGLLESAPDAMVIVNEKGTIDLINKQAEKLFGYTAEELVGNPVETLIPKRFLGNHTAYRDEFFAEPKTRSMGEGKDLFGINKNGEEIPIQISLGPLRTEQGLLVSVAIRDITTQKLAERKIIEAKENLEVFSNKLVAQNTQLADFTHITSHNLRAPVSNLNSLLDFYKISDSEEEKIDLFEKFETVIQHLTLTLNTLIEALKTKNETDKALEEMSFQNILNKTKEILSGEIIKSKVVVTSNFSKIENISYNRIYLESIFLNLVGNAIKYKSEDRVPELFIESEIKDGKIVVKFKDNGLGIDLERHGHKLFGLNKVFHRHPDAKGVGLFMTKTQIEAMGGIISATSKVNEGTTFIINFN